jgi:uncharacterized membrane protein
VILLLALGVLLWAYSHLMKRVTPGFRASLGDNAGKGVATVLSLISLVMMVYGYHKAPVIGGWTPPGFMVHINNLLMVIAVFMLNWGHSRGHLRTFMRHPMLTSVKIWAVAHLLMHNDVASVILFGGLLAWAVVDVILINRMEPAWVRPEPGPWVMDLIPVGVSVVMIVAIIWVHVYFGYAPAG